jgi:hypothetical protein
VFVENDEDITTPYTVVALLVNITLVPLVKIPVLFCPEIVKEEALAYVHVSVAATHPFQGCCIVGLVSIGVVIVGLVAKTRFPVPVAPVVVTPSIV